MRIDLSDMRLYRGASQCTQEQDGALLVSRMSEELKDLYNYSEAANIRACCATGVRLLFETDASWLKLRWRKMRCAREIFSFDVETAGQVRSIQPEICSDECILQVELLGADMRRTSIYLPHLCELRLLSLELSDNANFRLLEEKRRRLLLTGDSILQGMTTSSPIKAYGTAVARALNLDYLNIAVGGAVMNAAVAEAAAKLPWDIALLAFGVNDCSQGVGLETEAKQTEASLKALTTAGRKVILFTPLPWPGRGDKDLDSYIACQKKVAAGFPDVLVLDGYDAVNIDQKNFIDSCHPNDLGNQKIAEFLIRNIRQFQAKV